MSAGLGITSPATTGTGVTGMTTRRTDQEAQTEQAQQDAQTGRDVAYNEPYVRTAAKRPEAARPAWTPEAGAGPQGMAASPAPEVRAGRMSSADRISGGPIWSGFIISFAVWIFLQVVLVAGGLSQIQAGQGSDVQRSGWWWSLGAALIALFIGGLVSGIGSRWNTPGVGALQGLTVWALTFVGLLVLGVVGAGIGFGAFSDAISIPSGPNAGSVPPEAIEAAKDAAGVAAVGLVVTAAVAVLGGILGTALAGRTQRRREMPNPAAGR